VDACTSAAWPSSWTWSTTTWTREPLLRLRPLFQRPVRTPWGRRELRRPTATRSGVYPGERPLLLREFQSTRCASTRSTHNGLQRLSVLAQLAEPSATSEGGGDDVPDPGEHLNDSRIVTPGRGEVARPSGTTTSTTDPTPADGERDGSTATSGASEHPGPGVHRRFVYSGQYSAYRNARHGNPARHSPRNDSVFRANHGPGGNRMRGTGSAAWLP